MSARPPRIGLALGGGSARGWAHVGVIEALEREGIRPDVVCGTSIGALVGGAYAAGDLAKLHDWLLRLDLRTVLSLMDFHLNGGVLKGERLMRFFRNTFTDRPIEELDLPFGAVATTLYTGAEVWLRSGSTFDAVRASIALPGLFTPVLHEGQVLVDGGLVNPVPVSLTRAMGADIVIAVDLNADLVGQHRRIEEPTPAAAPGQINEWLRRLRPARTAEEVRLPSMLDVVTGSLNIMQVRITRSRMAGDPPDVVIAPRLAHLGLLDYHRAAEAIAEGQRAVELNRHQLQMLGLATAPPAADDDS